MIITPWTCPWPLLIPSTPHPPSPSPGPTAPAEWPSSDPLDEVLPTKKNNSPDDGSSLSDSDILNCSCGDKGVDYRGIAFSGGSYFGSVTSSFGLATCGRLGSFYFTYGAGGSSSKSTGRLLGTTAGAYPGAKSLNDYGGIFVNGSLGGADGLGGSVDGFYNLNYPASDPKSYGGGLTVGVGMGGKGGSGTATNTILFRPFTFPIFDNGL